MRMRIINSNLHFCNKNKQSNKTKQQTTEQDPFQFYSLPFSLLLLAKTDKNKPAIKLAGLLD